MLGAMLQMSCPEEMDLMCGTISLFLSNVEICHKRMEIFAVHIGDVGSLLTARPAI